MDKVRYYIALLLVLIMPGVYLYWFSIHPLVSWWRRVGARRTIAIHVGMMVFVGWVLFQARRELLAIEFGTNYLLAALGVPLVMLSGYLRRTLGKQLSLKALVGFPELAPQRYGSRIISEGIYSKIRHPRYLQFLLAVAGYALIANYLAAYGIVVMALLCTQVLVVLEERELRERLGTAYIEYSEKVPRFIPLFGTRVSRGPSN